LCEEQLASVELSMSNGISYITGSAGRGKSSAIMEIIRRSSGTIIATPTHAARKVVQRRVEKNNLQQYCRADVVSYIKTHASKYDLFSISVMETLILDEVSMIDVVAAHEMIRSLLRAFPTIIRIVFVGDTNQLRSAQKGNLLDDLIKSKIPGSTLTINHRSGSLSRNIDCILEGRADDIVMEPGKFEVLTVDDVKMAVDSSGLVIHVADKVASEMTRIEEERGFQTHSMCYMHREIDTLNSVFRRKHGPLQKMKTGLKIRVKDPSKIHGPTLYGNDLLTVVSSKFKRGIVSIRLREWSRTKNAPQGPKFRVCVSKSSLDQAFTMGFSTTCHAFQGDESDAVVIHAVQNCRYFDRLALYTAVSRARELIVLVTVK
ncbi:unnamed protein product, partial [Ectocarpus fasciculatus]